MGSGWLGFNAGLSGRRVTPLRRGALLVALSLASLASWLGAQAEVTPRQDVSVVNGIVRAFATHGNTLYMGGSFNYVGPLTGPGVVLDLATGEPIPPFPRLEGSVYAVVPDGTG